MAVSRVNAPLLLLDDMALMNERLDCSLSCLRTGTTFSLARSTSLIDSSRANRDVVNMDGIVGGELVNDLQHHEGIEISQSEAFLPALAIRPGGRT